MPRPEQDNGCPMKPPAGSYAVSRIPDYTLPVSDAAVYTKLRAETSELLGSMAKYCEELREDVVRPHGLVNRAKRKSPGNCDTILNSEKILPEAEHDTEAVVTGIDSDELHQVFEKAEEIEERQRAQKQNEVLGLVEDTRSERQGDGRTEESHHIQSLKKEEDARLSGGLTMLDLPSLQLETICNGYSLIKHNGEDWLDRLVAIDNDAMSNEGSKPTDNLTLWSNWKGRDNIAERALFSRTESQPETLGIKLYTVNYPQRIQSDWCEATWSGEHFLHDESNALFKKMVRVNAQAALLLKNIAVPNVFEGDWGREILDVRPPLSLMEGGEGLQQLLLPCDLVREDDAEVMDAPSKIVSIAERYLRLQRSDVSLTKAAMDTSSVWNNAVTTDRLAKLTAETLNFETPASETHPAFVQSDTPLLLHGKKGVDRSNCRGDTSKPRNALSNATIVGEISCSMQDNQLSPLAANMAIAAEESLLGTDYFMSDKFLNCNWDEPPEEVDDTALEDVKSHDPISAPRYEEFLQQIARPALWDLRRKKLIQVNGTSFKSALNCVSLETLEAIVCHQFRDVKKMSLNPSIASSTEIIDACASLRQAVWLHTLRIVSISQMAASSKEDMMSAVLAKLLPSAKYKLVLGPSNWKDLCSLLEMIGGNLNAATHAALDSTEASASEADPASEPPQKKQKVFQMEQEIISVRVLCSIKFLQQDELLDELCTEQRIFFIERHLPPPIDMLIDERNCICVANTATFQVQANVRNFIFGLARVQVQFQKCWIIIALEAPVSGEVEEALNLFYAALVQFRIEIQVVTTFSAEETSRYVRAIVDKCADIALNKRRILPRLWFERPFLLEEESQFERFLVSTKIINYYAAQSLLHKICIMDLFTKQIDELEALVQNALTFEQLQLLWGLVQQDHGLNSGMQ